MSSEETSYDFSPITHTTPIIPNKKNRDIYDQRFSDYLKMAKNMTEISHSISRGA